MKPGQESLNQPLSGYQDVSKAGGIWLHSGRTFKSFSHGLSVRKPST